MHVRVLIQVFAVISFAALSEHRAPAFAQGPYPAGSHVQASPLMIEGYWQDCLVVSGPDAKGAYRLRCGSGLEFTVAPAWIRPSATAEAKATPTARTAPTSAPAPAPAPAPAKTAPIRPVERPRVLEPQAPAPRPKAPAPPPGGASGAVALGKYECWAYSRPRLLLNFQVTGPGRYTASDGSASTFTFDPGSKAIRFSGYLGNVMPEGFTSIYHEPHGKPTVSFRGRGGAEASFCERVN